MAPHPGAARARRCPAALRQGGRSSRAHAAASTVSWAPAYLREWEKRLRNNRDHGLPAIERAIANRCGVRGELGRIKCAGELFDSVHQARRGMAEGLR